MPKIRGRRKSPPDGKRRCARCRNYFPVADFGKRKVRGHIYHQPYCADCLRIYNRISQAKWRAARRKEMEAAT